MSELKVNDSGTWRNITELKVNDSGTWRTIQQVYVNDSGTWRTVFRYGVVSLADINGDALGSVVSGGSGFYTLALVNDGSMGWSDSAAGGAAIGTWLVGGSAADYEVRLTINSGTSPSSGTVGSYVSLSSTQFWQWSRPVAGNTTAGMTLSIRRISDAVVQDTATFSLSFTVTP